VWFFLPAEASPPSPAVLVAARTHAPPTIDGRLDDEAWSLATPSDHFTQKFPDERSAPTERTTVRVLYDETAIYVGIDCEQLRAPIVARLTRRDREIEGDRVEVAIDSRGDGRTAVELGVNAAGTLSDSILYDDTEETHDWDEVWEGKAARTARGWSVEYKIPLRILRFSAKAEPVWGLQVRRWISARQEIDEWAFIPRKAAGEVSHFGKLTGLTGLRPTYPVELRPFVLGRVRRRDPVDDQVASGADVGASAGLDLKWHPTSGLALDVAVNPDFAQVEADKVVLNLTTFETFLPEKRPLFLEGVGAFATPLQIFYSRRVGRAPDDPALRAALPFGERRVDVVEPAPILGATKLVGRLGDRWEVGTLSALTGPSKVEVEAADGTRSRRTVAPLAHYQVVRVKRELAENAHAGAMWTAVTRADGAEAAPPLADGRRLCPAGTVVDPGRRCVHDAYTASLDARWRSAGGDYALAAQVLATGVHGGPTRTLRDGTLLGSGDLGPAAYVYAAKEGGTPWIVDVAYDVHGKKTDYNDFGYLERQNQHKVEANIEYRTLKPWWRTLETHSRLELVERDTLAGLNLARYVQLNTEWKLDSYWTAFVEGHHRFVHYDDREVGDGTALQRAGLWGVEAGLESDPRAVVSFKTFTQTQFLSNGFRFRGEGTLTLRPHSQVEIELLPEVLYTHGEPRFVERSSAPGRLVFGDLRAKSASFTLRATYTLVPTLSLQTYGQLFLASRHYSDFAEGAGPVVRIDELVPIPVAPSANPDTQDAALNVNAVVRWEYAPGSTIFLVYTRAQAPRVRLGAGEVGDWSFAGLGRAPAADVVLLKASYWWSGP
jgi:hypothetical protein